jgi:PAS domain S-box-containing protein
MSDEQNEDDRLLTSHDALESIYNSVPVGLCVLDRQLRYVRINDRLARLNGRPREAHLGRTVREVLPDVADIVEGIAARVFASGEPELVTEGPGVSTEHPARFGVWRAAWLPIKAPDGRVIGLSVVAEDVTDRRHAEDELHRSLATLERRVAERTAALADSERKYRELAENTRDIPFQLDRDGVIAYIGPQVLFYGMDPVQMMGRHFAPFICADDRERVFERFREALEVGERQSLLFRMVTPLLGERWFEERGVVQRDAAGQATGVTGILRDVTEAVQNDEALRESEERYRRLFELETSGIVLADLHSGEILDVNAAACAMYGYTREEFITLNAREVSAEPAASVAFVERLATEGRAEASPRWHRRKDGSPFPLDLRAVRINLRGRAIMFAVVQDISERLAREEALRESEEKYRRIFELETDAIIFIDMAGRRVLDVNAAAVRLYGYTREEFLALDVRALTAELTETEGMVNRLRQDGRAHAPVRRHRRKDGSILQLEVQATLFSLRGREVTFLVLREISGRLAREEENQRQREALERLAGEVTVAAERERQRIATSLHDDLVQMLVACQMRIDQILQAAHPREVKPSLRRVWEILDQATRDARTLTFTLAQPGVEVIGLPAALEQLCRELTAQYGIPFSLRVDGDPPLPSAEPCQVVFRCARELAINAGRHARAARVTLTIEATSKGARLTVEDDGCGFDARQAGSGFSATGGFGLFSIRKQLQHAGMALSIESTPGQGTRVTMEIPQQGTGAPSA